MNINVFEKEAGKDQSVKGAEKISYAAYSKKGWSDNGDTHSIELQFERDGIYKIEMKPSDIQKTKVKQIAQLYLKLTQQLQRYL